jgi:pilus assembly protein Flp/PilA
VRAARRGTPKLSIEPEIIPSEYSGRGAQGCQRGKSHCHMEIMLCGKDCRLRELTFRYDAGPVDCGLSNFRKDSFPIVNSPLRRAVMHGHRSIPSTLQEITMTSLFHSVKQFMQDEDGATTIEYALVAALISVVAATAIGNVGTRVRLLFEGIVTALTPTP